MQTVVIDCFPESVEKYRDTHSIVAVDVIRATTTAVTAVAQGRRCIPVPTIEAAAILSSRVPNALLAGELGGNTPYGFDMTNSPAEIAVRTDVERPMILLSTSGTRVICEAGTLPMFAACLRNYRAQVAYLRDWDGPIAVIGAGARGEFREEDALCCAWIAEGLFDAGFQAEDATTTAIVKRWSDASLSAISEGKSAEYLRRTDQMRDLEFILDHVDDLQNAYQFINRELVRQPVYRSIAEAREVSAR